MTLLEFNPENCQSPSGAGRKSQPRLRIRSNGAFTLSKGAEDLIGLKESDKVAVFQDKEDPDNFYLANLGPRGKGFELKRPKTGVLQFYNAVLAKKVRETLKGEGFEGHFDLLIAGKPTKEDGLVLFGLLNRPAI